MLESEAFAKVETAYVGIFNELGRIACTQDLTLGHYVCSIRNTERFANVMVRYQDADALLFQIENDLANIVYRDRVDTGEWLVKENELRLGGEAACDLDATPFSA